MKKGVFGLVLCLGLIGALVFSFIQKVELLPKETRIVSTNYIGYDLAKEFKDEEIKVESLVQTGENWHFYTPDEKILSKLEKADLIILNGGKSEAWLEDILEKNTNLAKKSFKMMNYIEPIFDENGEVDEHFWLNPVDTMIVLRQLGKRLEVLVPEKEGLIDKKAENYLNRIEKIDLRLRDIVEKSEKKEVLVGGCSSLEYLAKEYGLTISGSSGVCPNSNILEKAEQKRWLLERIASNGDRVMIKMSSNSVAGLAEEVAREAGVRLLSFDDMEIFSEQNENSEVGYIEIMERNLENLEDAL